MKSRNLLNIFLLCCVFGLFLVFGAVANAAEGTEEEKETYTYNATYKVPFVGGYTEVVIDGTYENRLCFYKTSDTMISLCVDIQSDTNTPYEPNIQKFITRYQNGNVQYTQLSTSFESGDLYDIKGDIPIFDGTTEAGKASALEYLKTGKLVKEGYNIYLNDLKVSDASKDVVNVSWTGYTLDPALRNNANIVDYKVERRVYPYVELSEGETDIGWNPWEVYSNSVPGKLLTADFIFSPSSKCPYKNGFSQLWLDLWPVCIDADGTEYVGKKYHYYFDADGNLTHSDNPIGSLTPIYDPDCNFVDFNVYVDSLYDKYGQPLDKGKTSVQECDMCYYFISATDFTHSYDVVSKDIKVFAYYPTGLSSGYEIPFDAYGSWIRSDLVKSGFSFDITLGQLRKRYGFSAIPIKRDNMDFTLRFIPYYYSGDNLYYGNASIVEITGNSAGEFQEVGDPSNPNNPKKKINPDVDISSGDAGGGSGGNTPTEADKNTVLSFVRGFFELMAALFQESVKFLKQLPSFLKSMWSLIDLVGQFPSMVSQVFSFLPSAYTTMLVGGLALAILLRIFGR